MNKSLFLYCLLGLALTGCPTGETVNPAPQPNDGGSDGSGGSVETASGGANAGGSDVGGSDVGGSDTGGSDSSAAGGEAGAGGSGAAGGSGGAGGEDPCPEGLYECKETCWDDFKACGQTCQGSHSCWHDCWEDKKDCKSECWDLCEPEENSCYDDDD